MCANQSLGGAMAEGRHYLYAAEIEWKGERSLRLAGTGLPEIGAGAPPEFGGREGQWSPEHLLVGSLNACYMLTLLAIAENSKVGIVSFSSSAEGKLERVGAAYQITEITVKPKLVLSSADNLARMPRILEKAKENCFISNTIKSSIKVEPEVIRQQSSTA
jgi:peroxiredoxin-like protein